LPERACTPPPTIPDAVSSSSALTTPVIAVEKENSCHQSSSGRLKQATATDARKHSTTTGRPQGLTSPERDTRRDRAPRNALSRRESTAKKSYRRPASRNAPEGGRRQPCGNSATWAHPSRPTCLAPGARLMGKPATHREEIGVVGADGAEEQPAATQAQPWCKANSKRGSAQTRMRDRRRCAPA